MSKQLEPCPFCGNVEPEFERIGTSRQSCIVACGNCGARHESSDEGEDSGASWNHRAQPGPITSGSVPLLTNAEIDNVRLALMGTEYTLFDFARQIEQAVRAKMGAGVYDKTELNAFVQDLYDRKMREGNHGHYETLLHCVHQAIKRAGIVGKEGGK